MKNRYTTLSQCYTFLAMAIMLLSSFGLEAQTKNNQTVVKKCWTGPTQTIDNSTGTLLPTINIVSGVDVPAGHKVVDVIVEIVWSKTDDGSCSSITGQAADLSHVGFQIRGPIATGPPRYLAASSATAGFAGTVNSFAGSYGAGVPGVIRDTIVFRDGHPSLLPSTLPNHPVRDTVSPNNDPLSYYTGLDPYGAWTVGGIDDFPPTGPKLCVHSYCITLVTCDFDTLVASCKVNPTIALNASGLQTITFAALDSISDVSCMTKSITFSPLTSFNCSHVGSTVPITMTLQDRLDSIKSCVSNVRVIDNIKPVIVSPCFSSTFGNRYLNAAGKDTFYASQVNITDNCGVILQQVRPFIGGSWGPSVNFSCVTGGQQFWVRGIDASGNMDSCRILINMIDTFPPTAICGKDTAYVGAGPYNVSPIDLDAGSFDVCPPITNRWINSTTVPFPAYTCADLGLDTVMLIVSDGSNNLDTCFNAYVTILDTTKPVAACQNPTVYLSAAGTATMLPAAVNNGSSDVCGISSMNINGFPSIAYNCTHVGTPQAVTLNLFDASGNTSSCAATVTVVDTIPPTAICRNFTVYVNGSGVATLVADSLNNNSSDVCTGTNLTFLIAGNPTRNFTCANIATNPNSVTLTVRDSYGNSSTCVSNVTVLDTISPTPSCTSPTVYLNNAGSATVTATQLSGAGTTDNCSVANRYVNVIGVTSTNYNCSAIFTPQPATLIVQDPSGNTASCATTVNVVDTIRPTAHCEFTYTAVLNAVGVVTVTPANIDSSSTDNCNLVQYLINGASSQTYSCSDIGSLVAVLTVRDSSGNIATCPSNIVIRDNTPPSASCQIANSFLNASGTSSITPSDVLAFPATADNCGSITTTFLGGATNINYTCDSLGARTVRVVVTDASGNTANCQTTVTVLDSIKPTASCRPVPYTVQLDATGTGFVVPTNVNNLSSDACGIADMLVNGVDTFFFNCGSIGNNAVTLFVFDGSGNQNECVALVNVSDALVPTALCHDTTLYLNASGVVTALPAHIDNGSSDNCTFTWAINNLPSVNYNCNQVGVNTAQLNITDGAGNTNQCSANITVRDTIKPVANCVAPGTLTVYLNSSCIATVPASIFNNGSTDNCAASLTYLVGGSPNRTFTVGNLATNPNPITLTVRDASGNIATCNTTVLVRDTTRPIVVCKIDTADLNGSGTVTVLPSDIRGTGSGDNCSVPVYTINSGPVANYGCINLGLNNATLTATDASGNAASCNTTVLVRDLIAPTANCNATVPLVLSPITSTATLTTGDVNNGSTDNCTITSFLLSKTAFNCGDIPNNPHTVSMIITDQSGNKDTCTTQVTVTDNVAPVASCQAGPLNLALVGSSVSITVADINNGSTDNCAIESMVLSQSTFNCSNIGANAVILTVTDSSGNVGTCSRTVNIADNTNPVAVCNSPTVSVNAAGTVTVSANSLALPGSFDNCSITTILVNGQPSVTFNCTNLGANVVTVFIQDQSGNSATCPSTITVRDSIPPTATCIGTPFQLYLNTAGTGTVTPANINNGSTDNCSISTMSVSPANFNCSNVATNPNNVTLTVTDIDGNSRTCVAQVNVRDTIKPTASCQPLTVNIHLSPGGVASITAAMFDNGSSDACGIGSRTFTGAPSTVTCANIGTTPITLTVTDVNGNSSTCNTTLTVFDTVSPTLTCNNITVQLNASGTVSINTSTPGLYTTNDACGAPNVTLNGGSSVNYTCANIGANNVTIQSTDGSGNTTSCVSVVTIQDTIKPTANCVGGPVVLQLNNAGTATLTTAQVNNVSTDNCTITSMTLSKTAFNCSDIGTNPNPVTLTVTDQSGNFRTCNTTINVLDTVRPTMMCQARTVYLNATGTANLTAAMFDNGSYDSCGIASITFSGMTSPVNCSNIGTHNITLTGTDVNGNVNTCNTTLTVLDTVRPTLTCNNITVNLNSFGNATVNGSTPGLYTMSDACGTPTLTLNGGSSVNYTCANVGTNNVVLTATDGSGNATTCTSVVTIQDVTAPSVTCAISSQVLGANGQLAIDPAWITGSIVEACGIATITTSPAVLTCANVGSFNTVTLTVTDINGNTSTCNGNIAVSDTTKPNMVCRDTTVCLGGGFVNVDAADIDSGTTDACGMSPIQTIDGNSNVVYTCSDIGIQVAVLEMQDVNGNIDTCHARITVRDCVPPNAVCKPTLNAYLTSAANGSVTVQAITFDNNSNDDCRIDSSTFRINGQPSLTFTCNQLGTLQNIMFTVADFSGNLDTCMTVLTVLDTIAPIARCKTTAINAVLSSTNPGQFFVNAFTLSSTSTPSSDNCSITTYLINGQARDTFDCSMIGLQSAVLTVIDASGNSDTCHTPVNVRDLTAPTATCQFTVNRFLNNAGVAVVPAATLVTTSSDNCSIASIRGNGQDTLTFTCANIGSNLISVVVSDPSGNTFTCSSVVNISDTLKPNAICSPNPYTAYLVSNNVVVSASAVASSSTDNCTIVSYTINGASSQTYNCSQIGVNQTATIRVTDQSGNFSTCTTTIIVQDTTPPVANCKNFTVNLSPTGRAIVGPQSINNTSTDNCGITTYLINGQLNDTFDCSNVGSPNIATLTVIDQYGNQSTCTANITVNDVTNPTILCPLAPVTFYLNNNGTIKVDPRDVATAQDTCSILYWYINGLPDSTFTCADVGISHLVQIRVEDPSGNSAQCSVVVQIVDTIPPTPGCQDLTVALDSLGSTTVFGSDLSLFNTDNCAIVDTLINGQNSITYNCDSIALSPLTAYVSYVDASGNTTTCTSQITVIDDIDPVITCNDTVTVYLNQGVGSGNGQAIVQATSLAASAYDACSPLTYQINGFVADTFNCTDVGNYPIAILAVTDVNGNQSNCVTRINVIDNLPPVALCKNINAYLNSSGNVSVNASSLDNGSVDNCTILNRRFSNGSPSVAYTCSDTGVHNVTLVVTDVYGNVDSCTATITVRDTIKPLVTCGVGLIANLTDNGQANLVFSASPGNVVVGSGSDVCGLDTIFVTPNIITCTSGSRVPFVITAIDNNGNMATCRDTVTVLLDRPTIVLPTQDTVLCEGETLPLQAVLPSGKPYTYGWTGPTGQLTFSPTTKDTILTNVGIVGEGLYIFTITPIGNGCPAKDSVYVDINEVQPPVLTGTEPCDGNLGTITLVNGATYIGSTITYNWYFNGTPTGTNTNTLTIPNMSMADSGSYSMFITVNQGPTSCSDSSVVGFDFDVMDLPEAPIPSANLPCEGQTLNLSSNAPNHAAYDWSGPASFVSSIEDPTRANATQAFAGTYTLTITDANGCSNVGSVAVVISPTPAQPNMMYTQPLCIGDLLELSDTSTYNFPPVLYLWESPSGTVDTTTIGQLLLSGATAGDYMLTVSMNGCLSALADTQTIVYEGVPTGTDDFFSIEFRTSLIDADIISNDNPNQIGYIITVIDSTNGGTVTNNGNGTITYVPRSGYFGTDTLLYALCDAQCPNSCDTMQVLIEVVTDFECFIPQGISPNGDGINDNIIVRCSHNYPNAVIQIFSRWGTLVYEGTPTGWNGTYNGADLPDGTYFYILKLNDDTYTGTGSDASEGRVGDQYTGYIMLQR